MRRFAALAVLVTAIFLAASSISVKQAHAGWDGANVDPACPGGGGLAGLCPSAPEACNSWAIFYLPSAPQVLSITPIFYQGGLLGYDCSVAYMAVENAGAPTFPDCPSGQTEDPMAASGCSSLNSYDKEQLGCPICENGDGGQNGANDPVGNPVNVEIGNIRGRDGLPISGIGHPRLQALLQ
jgi:hypothetical protein